MSCSWSRWRTVWESWCPKSFTRYNYAIYPTGADSSSQNGPVKRAHCTVSNGIKSCLIGAGIAITYWPFAFLHVLRIWNALPGNGQRSSPIHLLTGKKKTISRTSVHLVVECGLGRQVFKQSVSRTKSEKVYSLDMCHIQQEISFGMMLNHNAVK